MIKVRQLFKMVFLLMAIISLSACTKEDSGEGGGGGDSEYLWGETGSEATSLKKDVPMSDLETFIEYVAKVENLKLQTIKLFSNNWEGELFCGDMANANPDKMLALMTEILENKDRYEKAASQLEQSGILSNVTTRGPVVSTIDFISSLTDVASDDENLIKDALEKSKMMGDKTAQEQLFEVLPNNLRAGCTSASTWFVKFNNHELTTKAHEIKKCWYLQTSGSNDATVKFQENLDAVTGSKGNAVWNTAAKTTKTLADKGMNVQLSTLDELSGGSISKIQDVEIILEEVGKIREKYKDGTLKSNDFAKIETVVGKNLLDKVLEKYLLPKEYKSISDNALKKFQSEMTDYVYDKELTAAEEDAAKGTSKSIMQTVNNTTGNLIGAMTTGLDGKVSVGLPNKDGNVTVVTDANKEQTVTAVTDKGERATQKVKPQAGKETIAAEPAPTDLSYELDPTSLAFSASGGKETVVIYSDIKYYGVKSNDDWIRVTRNARTVIVEVDENESDEVRKGSITIAFSQDKQAILATATVPVTQSPGGDSELSLSFINPDKLTIDRIYSLQLGIYGFNYYNGDKTRLSPNDIKVTRVSDKVYEVKGRFDDSTLRYESDDSSDPDRLIDPSKPYGLHFDISFTMEATEPIKVEVEGTDVVIEEHSFIVRHLKIKGYSKYLYTYHYGDAVDDFDASFNILGLVWGWGETKDGKVLLDAKSEQAKGYSGSANMTYREWNDYGEYVKQYDENGKFIKQEWVPDWKLDTKNETLSIDDIELFLSW